jgi:L-arabinose isomerase
VQVVPNRFFPGVAGSGSGVTFTVRSGPATLLSLSPIGETWRLVWATGEILESRYPTLETPNAMFRFDHGEAVGACEAWMSSGATHHAAVAAGRLEVELETLSAVLRVETTRI